MPDPTTDDPGSTTGSTTGSTAGDAERSPTAAGRSGWIVIGLIGLVLAAVLALTAFWSDGSSSSAVPTADGSTSTSAATTSGSTGACAASVSEPLDPTAAIR
ncbi:MAG: hypothetical protein ACXWBN_00535, partial [Acidimicrobiales bacterium]